MRNIRNKIFETNSSSTHSLSIVSSEEFDKLKNGELYFDDWDERIVTQEEYNEKVNKIKEEYPCIDDDDLIERLKDYGIYTYESYIDYIESQFETFVERYTTKSGDEIVAFRILRS